MNAELDKAVGMFSNPSSEKVSGKELHEQTEYHTSDHWRWRMKMAEKIASELEAERFGVIGLYVFGSTKNAISGPGSDIDLIVHVDKSKCNLKELSLWFEGWSLALSEMNYLRTGYKASGMLDVHYVTDEDIKNKASYAAKIGAVTDAARSLKLKSIN
jgi:predicted nucleotidyltransferase